MQMSRNHLGGFFNETEVGLTVVVQGRGDAHNDGVYPPQPSVIRRRAQPSALHGVGYKFTGHVLDIRFTTPQMRHFGPVNIKSSGDESRPSEGYGQWEPDVSEAR